MAIQNFKTKGTEDINYGRATREALRTLPREIHRRAQIKLARLGAVTSMQDLQEIRGNRFEKLKGERQGQYSIRINLQTNWEISQIDEMAYEDIKNVAAL
jgi:proteic killer suppression protein